MSDETTATTILLVDDDQDLLFQLQMQLESSGYTVLTADNRERAQEILAESTVSLAVVDLMMSAPDDGFVLCHFVKKMDPAIPVILVSAVTAETGLEFDAATEEERGWVKADVFLPKPVRLEQLEREIRRLLAGRQ